MLSVFVYEVAAVNCIRCSYIQARVRVFGFLSDEVLSARVRSYVKHSIQHAIIIIIINNNRCDRHRHERGNELDATIILK